MKQRMRRVLSFALALLACAAPAAFAQSRPQPQPEQPEAARGAAKGNGAAKNANDRPTSDGDDAAAGKSAQALYEEAASYARLKFEEFEAKQIPFNELLRHEVLHEQRGLAERHVAALAARGPVAGQDLYYSGLLYLLAGRGPAALDAMRDRKSTRLNSSHNR
jgi:hypothetical protein